MTRKPSRTVTRAVTAVLAGALAVGVVAPVATAPAAAAAAVKIGMSSPNAEWAARLREVGPIESRRLFGDLASPTNALKLATSEVRAGRMPILSFKVPGDDWAGVASGRYDAQIRSLATKLAALGGRVFVAIHHEPNNDGTPAQWVAMQRRVLPMLSPSANVDAGVIVNGFWWSDQAAGLTDVELARWLPAELLRLAEVVAADTYHGGTLSAPGEPAAPKIRNLSAWASRVGVRRLGLGEYNGLTAAAIRDAGDAILADPRYVFAAVFNSSKNNRDGVNWLLTGDRLTAFKGTVRAAA